MANDKSRVAFVNTENRQSGVSSSIKTLGSNAQIMKPKIFKQEQIARAIEIGLGATSPAEIEVVSANPESREYRDRVVQILHQG